jgi:hypothetical protein
MIEAEGLTIVKEELSEKIASPVVNGIQLEVRKQVFVLRPSVDNLVQEAELDQDAL